MAKWKYVGIDKKGKRIQGNIDGKTTRDIRKVLRARGIRPLKIDKATAFDFDISVWLVEKGIGKPFTINDLTNFTRQLAVMISAGIPILQSLELLFKQEKNLTLKATIRKVSTEVGGGKSFSEALSMQKGFDKLYCNLIKAGEAGGVLEGILVKLAKHLDERQKLNGQIKSAMMYPTIVTLVGIGVVYAMMVFVVPQFVGMLSDTGQEIPAITQFVIGASKFLREYTIFILPIVFIFCLVFLWAIKTPIGKAVYDRVVMQIPLMGPLTIKGNVSNFARTLSTMLTSGVSLVDALEICIDTMDNGVIMKDIQRVKKAITEGKTLAEPLGRIPYFPEMIVQMVQVGEQTGNIDTMLGKVADVYEDDVRNYINGMTKLIEPLILVVLGGIIAGILVAMYLPMFMAGGGPEK